MTVRFEDKCYKQGNTYYISDDAYVFESEFHSETEFAEHNHSFVELIYVFGGKCVHTVDGKDFPVKRGDLVMVNYGQSHSYRANASGKFVNILLKPGYISQNLKNRENAFALLNLSEFEDFGNIIDPERCRVTFSGDERAWVEELIGRILKEIERDTPGAELAVRSMFNLLLITVFRKMSLEMEKSFDGVSERLLNYIATHCDQPLTLSQIALMCNYNTSYFSRLFKEYTGKNFTEYLKNERIKRARELLRTTELKVSEIIGEIGYADSTKFYSDFKKITGDTPKKYRKSKK